MHTFLDGSTLNLGEFYLLPAWMQKVTRRISCRQLTYVLPTLLYIYPFLQVVSCIACVCLSFSIPVNILAFYASYDTEFIFSKSATLF